MNFAFPAVFLVLLLLPGFIFRHFYSRAENAVIDPNPFTTDIIKSFIFAVGLHLGGSMVAGLFGYQINLPLILELTLSPEAISKPILQTYVFDRIFEILSYFGLLFISAALLASGFRKLIMKFNLDEKISLLRFDAPWYYLFKVPYDADLSESPDLPDLALVSFLMDTNDGTFLFTGFLESFFLTKAGQLDRIILLAPMRRKLSNDFVLTEENVEDFNINEPNFDDRYYLISANKLVAKYDQMKNLTVSYVKLP